MSADLVLQALQSLHYQCSTQPGTCITISGDIDQTDIIDIPVSSFLELMLPALNRKLVVTAQPHWKVFPVVGLNLPLSILWVSSINAHTRLHLANATPPLPNLLSTAATQLYLEGTSRQISSLAKQMRIMLEQLEYHHPMMDCQEAAHLLLPRLYRNFLLGRAPHPRQRVGRFKPSELLDHLEAFARAARHTVQEMKRIIATALDVPARQAFE